MMVTPATKTMNCADEGFQPREFELTDEADTSAKPDYTCKVCGWMQTSARAGGNELLACATWHSDQDKAAFAALVAQQEE